MLVSLFPYRKGYSHIVKIQVLLVQIQPDPSRKKEPFRLFFLILLNVYCVCFLRIM